MRRFTLISLVALIGMAGAQAILEELSVQGELAQLADFISAREITVQDGPEGRDYILLVDREEAVPAEWLTRMRAALAADDMEGVVSTFAVNQEGQILAAARRLASGVIVTGEAALSPRSDLPGTGEVIPTIPTTTRAGPLPPRSSTPRRPSSSSGQTWGAECTTYQYGNTYGVRCRSW